MKYATRQVLLRTRILERWARPCIMGRRRLVGRQPFTFLPVFPLASQALVGISGSGIWCRMAARVLGSRSGWGTG